jgi:YD repeat-containing protein
MPEGQAGESFAYAYDAGRPFRSPSNRRVFTSTTPLSGTLVTTYTYDAANRLTARSASDGRAYVYEWSQRGQLLAENTQGVDVRTFTYDGAGRLVEAAVFTLTTRFTYDGLGARTHVEVVGHGTTTVTLDYAAGNVQKPVGLLPSRNASGVSARILAEATITGTTTYLYGHDCLGQYDGTDDWLYYLNDGDGLVRQSTDAEGEIVSAWLFDPDGTVLEGPEGPVSHLVCGGVYDWSTGLVYKDGRYFDPMLGIWLALTPLVVVQSWRRRRERRGGLWAVMLALFLVGVGGMLTGCIPPSTPEPIPQYCIDVPSNTPQVRSFTATLGEVDTMGWTGRGENSLHLGHPPESGKPYGIVFKADVLVPDNATGYSTFAQIWT